MMPARGHTSQQAAFVSQLAMQRTFPLPCFTHSSPIAALLVALHVSLLLFTTAMRAAGSPPFAPVSAPHGGVRKEPLAA